MKVHNKSRKTYQHSELNKDGKIVIIDIKPDEVKEISDKIAKVWLKTGDVVEFADPKEQAQLQDENAKLKEEIAALKATTKKTTTKKAKK